jgi:hypothetical protein
MPAELRLPAEQLQKVPVAAGLQLPASNYLRVKAIVAVMLNHDCATHKALNCLIKNLILLVTTNITQNTIRTIVTLDITHQRTEDQPWPYHNTIPSAD